MASIVQCVIDDSVPVDEPLEALEDAPRPVRTVAGFFIILLGIITIPFPGPGWLIVIFGLDLLPYEWSQKLIVQIRRRIPGVPLEGTIPKRTWILLGLAVTLSTVVSIFWGAEIKDWAFEAWDSLYARVFD